MFKFELSESVNNIHNGRNGVIFARTESVTGENVYHVRTAQGGMCSDEAWPESLLELVRSVTSPTIDDDDIPF